MLLRWLPTDAPCPVASFATHIVGCGGLVINPKGEVLCVREKHSLRKTGWKLPGGTTTASECRPLPWPQPRPAPPRPAPPRLPAQAAQPHEAIVPPRPASFISRPSPVAKLTVS